MPRCPHPPRTLLLIAVVWSVGWADGENGRPATGTKAFDRVGGGGVARQAITIVTRMGKRGEKKHKAERMHGPESRDQWVG